MLSCHLQYVLIFLALPFIATCQKVQPAWNPVCESVEEFCENLCGNYNNKQYGKYKECYNKICMEHPEIFGWDPVTKAKWGPCMVYMWHKKDNTYRCGNVGVAPLRRKKIKFHVDADCE